MEKAHFRMKPVQKISLGFLGMMLLGGCILALPVSWAPGKSVSLLDAMFSSFSAVCVTGLSTIEIGTTLSLFGQLVMLFLIQIGGLGFMTSAAILFMALGRRFSLTDRMAMQESLNESKLQGVVKTTLRAVYLTGICEAAGTIALSFRFIPMLGFWKGLYYSIFHAVSAFCNAGFDILGQGSSMASFANDPLVLCTLMALIVIGGLGFMVVIELGRRCVLGKKRELSLQAKVVIVSSLVMIAGGAILFCLMEWNNSATIGTMDTGGKILNGVFQSVTTRTAGFATINQGQIRAVSALLTVVLMFVGASPAGTGGGIKTTTVAIILKLLVSIVQGKDDVTLYKRRVNSRIVLKAMAIFLFGLLFVGVMTLALAWIENGRFEITALLYEVTSAFGTVGLSQGITALLSTTGKLAIIACMYAGRVGLMTIMMAVSIRFAKGQGNIHYAEEKIMVG